MTLTLYDMHTHTDCSHDSTQPIDALCAAEIAAGFRRCSGAKGAADKILQVCAGIA